MPRSRSILAPAIGCMNWTLPSGTRVREFVGTDGKVFAVAWNGPTVPNLRQALGRYFDAYVTEAKNKHAGHGQLQVSQSDLVVQSGGHMRAFAGRAYLPQSIPERRRHRRFALMAKGQPRMGAALLRILRWSACVAVCASAISCGGGSGGDDLTTQSASPGNFECGGRHRRFGPQQWLGQHPVHFGHAVRPRQHDGIAKPSITSRSTPRLSGCAFWRRC